MNLFLYAEAGLYQICCTKTNKTYIGESQNLLERFGTHVGDLSRLTHDCIELQADWDKYDKKWFRLEVLYIGPEWQNSEKRIAKETQLIQRLPLTQRYNQIVSNKGRYQQRIEIDKQLYPTITSAAKALNVSQTTIRRRMNSKRYPNYIRKKSTSGQSISINGIVYESLQEAVEQKLAKDRFQVLRRLKSDSTKWKLWVYIDKEKQV